MVMPAPPPPFHLGLSSLSEAVWAVIIVMGDPCFMLSKCYRFSWYLSLLLLPSSLPFAGRALHRRSAPGWPNESLS